MDLLSIATSVGNLSGRCAYAPQRYSSEAKIISKSLSQLQNVLVGDEHSILTESLLDPDIRNTLDIALTGCKMTLSCIETEVSTLTRRTGADQKLLFSNRAKFVWKGDRFKELLQQLSRQHNAIATLQQGFQMKALEDIVTLMVTNRAAIQKVADDTESLRGLYPQFKAAGSFLESIDSHESNEHCFSIISERQFEFDDVVTNSQAYRRVLVAATQTLKTNNRENTLGGGTAIDTTIASGPLEKQNNITQTANQSRKINASLPPRNGGLKSKTTASSSSATLPEDSQSQSTIIKDSNTFAQQLRGYLDHVEGEMGSAAKENAQLRQMLKEKVNEVEITEIEKDMEAERADDAENRLKVALAENAQLRTECEALLNGRAEVAAAFYTVNGAYKKLYIEAEARKNDLKTLEAENGNVKKELVQLREAHSDLDFMKQRGENTLTEAIKELEAQEAENIHLFKKLEELQGKKVLLETTQRSLLQKKNLLHDELVSTILQLEETKLEHDKLKQDASNLEDSLPKGCTIHFARINATLVPLQFPTSFDRTLSPPLFQLIYAPKKP